MCLIILVFRENRDATYWHVSTTFDAGVCQIQNLLGKQFSSLPIGFLIPTWRVKKPDGLMAFSMNSYCVFWSLGISFAVWSQFFLSNLQVAFLKINIPFTFIWNFLIIWSCIKAIDLYFQSKKKIRKRSKSRNNKATNQVEEVERYIFLHLNLLHNSNGPIKTCLNPFDIL